MSPEKSCTKITKENKRKPQVIVIACCLFLHTPDSACTYSIWHEARHSTQQRKHASVLSLWLCWVPPVGLPAKGLEASEYLYTVHTAPSQTPTQERRATAPQLPLLSTTGISTSSSSRQTNTRVARNSALVPETVKTGF